MKKSKPVFNPISCDKCFMRNSSISIAPNSPCKAGGNFLLLILIKSRVSELDYRSAFRRTWLRWSTNNTSTLVRYIFLIGQSRNNTINTLVQQEANVYHDILQGSFIDGYDNLTYKVMMGVDFASYSCVNAPSCVNTSSCVSTLRYVMISDGDVFVHIPNLVDFIKRHPSNNSIQGHCYHGSVPRR